MKAISLWDWKAIGACLLTAAVFWTFQSLNANHTTHISVPLQILLDSSELAWLKPAPTHIEVRATGHGWNLLRAQWGIGLETVAIEASSHHVRQIPQTHVETKIAEVLKNFKLDFVVQDTITLHIDTLVSKTFPLALKEEDIPLAQGFRMTSSTIIHPNTLTLRGPQSLLASLPKYLPLQLSGEDSIRQDFEGEAHAVLPKEQFIEGAYTVRVKFAVSEFTLQTIRAVLLLENFPKKKRIKVSPDIAFLQYWILKQEHGAEIHSPVIILDYYQMNWMDSSIVPSIELPGKYVDPMALPNKFKIKIE